MLIALSGRPSATTSVGWPGVVFETSLLERTPNRPLPRFLVVPVDAVVPVRPAPTANGDAWAAAAAPDFPVDPGLLVGSPLGPWVE